MIEAPFQRVPDKKKKEGHLNEEVSPIIACVGTKEHFKDDPKIQALLSGKLILNKQNIDFSDELEDSKRKGIKSGGSETYVISPVDDLDKYSGEFYECSGVVFAGIDRTTGKNISFVSHQRPEYFLSRNNIKFSEDLINQIRTIKERCKEGTVDAVIFGGRYAKVSNFEEQDPARDAYIEIYLRSIEFLSKMIKDEIGFEPLVIAGPKTIPGGENVFYDNENRRLYFLREKEDFESMQSFSPSELEERRKNWKPGEWPLPF
jgi:hypothetical protein